jgi:hypothetical protein
MVFFGDQHSLANSSEKFQLGSDCLDLDVEIEMNVFAHGDPYHDPGMPHRRMH